MLDRVTRLPGAPCVLARGTWLGRVAFYQVNGSCRAITANPGETNCENIAVRGEFFHSTIYGTIIASVICQTELQSI